MKAPVLLVAWLLLSAACASDAADPASPPGSGRSNEASTISPLRVTVNPAFATIRVGSSVAFQTVVRNSRGQEVWPVLTWKSSDSTIARVGTDGVVTGVRPGQVTITAECLGGVGQAQVTVEAAGTPVAGALSWAFMLAAEGLAPVYDVWGSSTSDVFAVGSSVLWDCCGTILHYDGGSWSYMRVPPDLGELHGVWGSSARDVFAVGWDNVILHYDGTAWSRMPVPSSGMLEAVWGSSATDVYAVGVTAVSSTERSWHWRGLILHYDGSAWTEVASPLPGSEEEWLTDVWGTSARDVFVVGSTALHYDGVSWSVMVTPPVQSLHGVWGSAGNNVFAVGSGGMIIHYDGSAWQTMPSPPRNGDLMGIWGNSGSDIYAVGDRQWWGPGGCCSDVLHYDGIAWRVEPRMTGQALFDVWTTPNAAFIVGSGPTIIQGTR